MQEEREICPDCSRLRYKMGLLKLNISRESLYNLYIAKKMSSIKIGEMFNCSNVAICSRLREFGIPIRDRSEAHIGQVAWNKRDDINKESLYNLYITKKLSSADIGKMLDCDNVTIRSRLREFGIPVRPHKLDINKEELRNLYITKKLSSAKVGKILNYNDVTIQKRLREFGIPIRLHKIDVGEGRLKVLYIAKKLSSAEIGKMFNCNFTTICSRLREFGIPIRSGEELIKARLRRHIPSSLEVKFQNIINKHNLPYRYVGNGAFILGHFNPDFINTNSEKVAIEVYARYYKLKRPESIEKWKEKRTQVFKSYGWKLLFFNEIEVSEKNVLKVLRTREVD